MSTTTTTATTATATSANMPRTTRSASDSSATAVQPPKTVLDKIVYAIRQQPTSAPVSRVIISKYLKEELSYVNAAQVKRALKKGVDTGILQQRGQSFVLVPVLEPVLEKPIETPIVEEEVQTVTSTDVVLGKGDVCTERGDSLTVKYVGTLEDETMFDAESSFEFTLGAGDVLAGWDQGAALLGLKVGGIRKLIVPPTLGYDNSTTSMSRGPDIPPDSTLYFEITLNKLTKGGTSASSLSLL